MQHLNNLNVKTPFRSIRIFSLLKNDEVIWLKKQLLVQVSQQISSVLKYNNVYKVNDISLNHQDKKKKQQANGPHRSPKEQKV